MGASETVYFTVVTHNEPDGTEQQETPSSQPPPIWICGSCGVGGNTNKCNNNPQYSLPQKKGDAS